MMAALPAFLTASGFIPLFREGVCEVVTSEK